MNQLFEISRSGMDVEWRRVEVVAQNIANIGSTASNDAGVYRPLQLLAGARAGGGGFAGLLAQRNVAGLHGVQVLGLQAQRVESRLVHEPGHPHADANGMVRYPGVDHIGEMTTMMKAVRSYEANLAMLNAGRTMFVKALEIGNRS